MAKKANLTMGGDIATAAEAVEADALTAAYSVHIDRKGGQGVDHDPSPQPLSRKPQDRKSPAEWAYERIVMYIKTFEEGLDNDHEVAMGFVGSDAGTLRIQGMGYFAPDMVTFHGVSATGARMQLIQHVNQLNVMLVSEPKATEAQEPARIGFRLAADLARS